MAGQLDHDTRQKQVLQDLLETVFSEAELDRFCAHHFPPACRDLAADTDKTTRVERLVEYAGRQNLLGHLAALVERAEPEATRQFVQHRRANGRRKAEETRKTIPVAHGVPFRSKLRPRTVASGQVVRVAVKNMGHAAQTFVVRPRPEPGLVFQPGRRRVRLAAGASGAAAFKVSFRRRRLIGRTRTKNFSLLVGSSRASTIALKGSVIGRSLVTARWVIAAALLAFLGLAAGAAFYPSIYSSPGAAAATANLVAGQATAQAATVQAFLTQSAATAAAQTATPRPEQLRAATATAAWLASDADGDGLTNGEEVSLGTRPDVRDTDRDGLDDGEEVKRFLTNPLNPDSDYDGKLDGEEVRLGLNPTLQDTDGDGIPDALDTDPGPAAANPDGSRTPGLGFSSAAYVIDEREGEAIITVLLDPPAGETVSVDYSTHTGTAEAGSDYRTSAGTLVFSPGETRQGFVVPIINDTIDEPEELLRLRLANPRGVSLAANDEAWLTILDDDDPLSLRFSQGSRLLGLYVSGPAPVYEASENQGRVIIDVVLSAPAAELIRVDYTTNDSTATAGLDYQPTQGSLFFDPGVDRRTFELVLVNDNIPETNELVILSLSNAAGARIDTPRAELIIVDDDF